MLPVHLTPSKHQLQARFQLSSANRSHPYLQAQAPPAPCLWKVPWICSTSHPPEPLQSSENPGCLSVKRRGHTSSRVPETPFEHSHWPVGSLHLLYRWLLPTAAVPSSLCDGHGEQESLKNRTATGITRSFQILPVTHLSLPDPSSEQVMSSRTSSLKLPPEEV